MSKDRKIVWMDLEMTGLNPETDEIIEIATLITDSELNIIAEGPELIINQPESRFDKMDEWNQTHHVKSGLWGNVIKSEINIEQAQNQTLDFLKEHVGHKKSPLAGNSIWQDRRFIVKYMPNIDEYLHYRLIDVSTIKELSASWYKDLRYPTKKGNHRAMDDIKESVAELKFYRENVFK